MSYFNPQFLVPSGSVLPYAGASAPTGWLLCNGAAVSRATYATLFAIIGTTFGPGDGSTTFNVPQMAGLVPVGVGGGIGAALGGTGGEVNHTLTTGEMPSHTHSQNAHSHSETVNSTGGGGGAGIAGTSGPTSLATTNCPTTSSTATNNNTGGDGAHNNVQPYLALNYLVKT